MNMLLQIDVNNVFDPATAKLGGVLLLTIHMTIMAQFKRFFGLNPRKIFFDFVNYPLSFLECLLVLPPWPLYSGEAWGNYIGASIGLAILASVTAQKVRDAPESTDEEPKNDSK